MILIHAIASTPLALRPTAAKLSGETGMLHCCTAALPQMVLDLFPMAAAAGSTAATLLRSWQMRQGCFSVTLHSCKMVTRALYYTPPCSRTYGLYYPS
jgi:hypothetical protein